MKAMKALLGTVPLLLLLGCSNPADNVPAAAVKSASNSTGTASDRGGQYFAFGPDSATIEFIGSKVTGSHHGGFRNFAGEFRVVNGQVSDSGNKIVIEMDSIWADNDRVAGHLKSPDFFNVAQLPTATFVSTSVAQKAGDSTVTGHLTFHGVTKQISFPARIQACADAVDVTAEFVLNRFDFDIKYPGKANDLIRKEVVLKLKVKAAPGRAKFASVEQPEQTAVASAQTAGAPGGRPRRGMNR